GAGMGQAVQQLALAKGRRLGRVQILGARAAEGAAAEADRATPVVLDREHDPVAEAVVAGAAVLRSDDQPGLEQLALGVAFGEQRPLERIALVRRVAEAEALDRRAIKPASLQICGRLGAARAFEAAGEPARRGLVGGVDAAIDGGPALTARARRRQPAQLGQALQRRPELEALDRHDEVDRVAVLTAAEAVIEALVRNDVKRRRLLVVERAAAPQIAAAPAQPDMAPDHVADRQSCLELLERDRGSVSHAAPAVPLAVPVCYALNPTRARRPGLLNPIVDK